MRFDDVDFEETCQGQYVILCEKDFKTAVAKAGGFSEHLIRDVVVSSGKTHIENSLQLILDVEPLYYILLHAEEFLLLVLKQEGLTIISIE